MPWFSGLGWAWECEGRSDSGEFCVSPAGENERMGFD